MFRILRISAQTPPFLFWETEMLWKSRICKTPAKIKNIEIRDDESYWPVLNILHTYAISTLWKLLSNPFGWTFFEHLGEISWNLLLESEFRDQCLNHKTHIVKYLNYVYWKPYGPSGLHWLHARNEYPVD